MEPLFFKTVNLATIVPEKRFISDDLQQQRVINRTKNAGFIDQ